MRKVPLDSLISKLNPYLSLVEIAHELEEKVKMQQNNVTKRPLLRSQRILLPLIVVAVLLFVVALSSAGKPAYAASPASSSTPNVIVGGGGGNPPPQIMGQIFNAQTGGYAANVTVCLYDEYWNIGAFLGSTTTDSQGNFDFSFGEILANGEYLITINGYQSGLGTSPIDPTWCQYDGYVWTNSGSQGLMGRVLLPPAAVVNVTYAALYSNTQFATLSYGLGSSSDFNHTLSFGVLNSGISVGYTTSESESYTGSVTGVESIAIQMMYYSNAFLDGRCSGGASAPGVVEVGITSPVPNHGWYQPPISDYITNPLGLLTTDLSHTFSFAMGPSTEKYYYSESGSYTWGASAGSPFGILFSAWGNVITLDETVTTTTGHTDDVTMSVTVQPGYGELSFMAYCPGSSGTSFNPLEGSVGTGGFELHIWDMSDDG